MMTTVDEDLRELDRFVFSKLPLCGCGDPESILELYRDILRHRRAVSDADDWRPLNDEWTKFWDSKDETLMWLALYTLDHADLIEHGGGVRASWLTGSGYRFLELLEHYGCDVDEWNELRGRSSPSQLGQVGKEDQDAEEREKPNGPVDDANK
jgi:hypothetical protein